MKKIAVLVAVAAAVAIAGTAIAAFPDDNVKLYTGCLTSGGTIVNVAEGNNALQACSSPKQVVKLSGGDITSLTVTAPLTGGGTNGAVTIGLAASATLPSCSTQDNVPKWNVSTSKWVCGTDNDTTYTKGTGLDLNGNEFSINQDYRVKNTPDCASGQFVTGFTGDGTPACSTPSSATARGYAGTSGAVELAGTQTIVSLDLPPGKYLLSGSVVLENKSGDEGAVGDCLVPGYSTGLLEIESQDRDSNFAVSVSLTSAITHAGGAVELKCHESSGNVDVNNASFTAIKVDTLN